MADDNDGGDDDDDIGGGKKTEGFLFIAGGRDPLFVEGRLVADADDV